MKIRKATKKDFKRCNKIIYDCIQQIRISKKMKEFLRKKYTLEGIDKLSKKCNIIVCEKFGRVQGSGKLCGHEIGMLYINPCYQKKKIGTKIITYLENFAKKKGMKSVYVDALTPATEFYKKLGYEKIASKGNNKDKHKMEKKIK